MNSKIRHVDIAILGAGISGLAAAYKAKILGLEAAVFEAKETGGGLLDNFIVEGFRFDNAVHLSFASESEVRLIFDQVEYTTHSAESYCFDNGTWLKHPVQNNLYPLDAETKVELITSFISRGNQLEALDYESWLRHQYGDKISERYPLRYTRKYWQCEANELSTTWIGNRMRRAELNEILFGSFTDITPNTYYTKEMRYPKVGGFKSFIYPLLEGVNIFYSYQATKIDLINKEIEFSNGEILTYDTLISSLPLPVFISLLTNSVPSDVIDSTKKLEATSIDLISIGFDEKIINDLWFYIYDEDILASRAYSPSVKSSDNAPDGCSSIQFEIYNPGRRSQYDIEEMKDNTLYALKKLNISDGENIIFIHHKHLPWGNVTFKQGMEEHRNRILKYLCDNNIKSIGRFGEWDYFWSNQSFLSGYNWDKL